MIYYITDGTPETFFTAVFDAYKEKDCIITTDCNIQISFDSIIYRVQADRQKTERVLNCIDNCDANAKEDILLSLRSCDPLKEQIAFKYIKKLTLFKSSIKKRLSLPEVIEFNDLLSKVTGEAHRMKGFLRFMENRDGILYAPYSPDNNITDILMRPFAQRLKSEKFVIHDLKRKIAGMYDGREWILCYAENVDIYLSETELAFEKLWKKYYKTVNIEERPHEKQMKGYMPARYWKFLPEKQD